MLIWQQHFEGHSKTSFEKNCFSAWESALNIESAPTKG